MTKLKVKLKLKRGLKKHDLTGQLVTECVKAVKDISNYSDLKLDQKLTVCIMKEVMLLCKTIDNDVKSELDKSEIVKKILTEVFNLNDAEILELEKQIEYIIDSGVLNKGVFLKILRCSWKILRKGLSFIIG